MAVQGSSVGEMIDFINDTGLGVIGTPAMAVAQIERLWAQSNGGFGCYMLLGHNWADREATLRSVELLAREVMPRFQGHAQATLAAAERARSQRTVLAATHAQAVEAARERYAQETAARN